MKKANTNVKIVRMTQLAILIAIIIIMAFTPLGYLKTAGLEITFITIPVIVGAIVLGPSAGAILGGVFGITSFLQAAMGISAFGVVLMELNPVGCFIVCIPTRILMGFVTGLIWKAFKKESLIAYSVTSLSGALLNTLFFMSALVAFYWNSDFIRGLAATLGTKNIFAFVIAFVGTNGLIEAICCFVVAAAVSKAVNKFVNKV